MKSGSPAAVKAARTRRGEIARAKSDLLSSVSGLELIGEVVMWEAAAGRTTTFSDVKAALLVSGHDEKYAREFKPEHAFTRAAHQLETERLIHEVGRTDDEIIFQYTKTGIRKLTASVKDAEKTFSLETKVELNRKTGRVSCKVPELERRTQEELDRAMIERTTSDITNLVQRMFDDYAASNATGALIPARSRGGAYLILDEHRPFVDRVEQFLVELGGWMNRWPVPKGTSRGDSSAARSIEDMFKSLIAKHSAAIETFGESTRPSTIEAAADEIRDTRVKLEAYASYLGGVKGDIEEAIAEWKDKLIDKIRDLVDAGKGQVSSNSGAAEKPAAKAEDEPF